MHHLDTEKALDQITKLEDNLFIWRSQLMKKNVARHILTQAIINEQVTPNKNYVIESSSGSMALGLALVCNEFNLKFHLFTDPSIRTLLPILEQLNVEIHLSAEPLKIGGFQMARLKKLFDFKMLNPTSFWTRQYENLLVLECYSIIAKKISEQIQPDIIVGSVGSGGSLLGISQYFNDNKNLNVIAVDLTKSILFGRKDGPRKIPGMGNSILPKHLKEGLEKKQINQVHFLSEEDVIHGARELNSKYQLSQGLTSGAAYKVASWISKQHPSKSVLFIGPDSNERYYDTFFNKDWLDSNFHGFPFKGNHNPIKAKDVHEGKNDEWSYLNLI